MIKRENFILVLEVAAIIPLYYRVLNLADAAEITVDLHDLVRMQLVMVLIICQHSLLGWLRESRFKPFDRVQVK